MPSPDVAHLTLVTGTESLLVGRAVRSVVSRVQALIPDVERHEVDAEDDEAAGLLLSALSPSLFGDPAIVVVRDMADASDVLLTTLLAGLADLANDVWVVVVHSGTRNKKALDALRKVRSAGPVNEVDCAEVKPAAAKTLLASEARAAGRRITQDGIDALIAAMGPNASLLVGSLEQLLTDNPTGDITAQVVASTFPWSAKTDAFKVADALFEGRGDEAIQLLRIGLETESFTGPGIVAAFAYKVRSMVMVAGAPPGTSDAEVASLAKVPPFRVRPIRALAQRWGQRRLATAIVELAELDAMVKGGTRKGESLDPAQKDAALEAWVTTMATGRE